MDPFTFSTMYPYLYFTWLAFSKVCYLDGFIDVSRITRNRSDI